MMRNNPQFLRVFAELGHVVTDIPESLLRSWENYVCAIYGFPKVFHVNRLRSLIYQSQFGARLPRIMSTESERSVAKGAVCPHHYACSAH